MDKDFEQHEAKRRAEQREIDQRDFNNEVAGVETGSAPRFGILRKRKEQERQEQRRKSRHDLLIQSLSYQEAWNRAMKSITDAEQAVYEALIKHSERLYKRQAEHKALLDRAATLSTGKQVFKDEQGNVLYEDGSLVPEDLTIQVTWEDDNPSWNEIVRSSSNLENSKGRVAALEGYSFELEEIRRKMEEKDKRPSIERLHILESRALAIKEEASFDVKQSPELQQSATVVPAPDLKLTL